MSGQHTQGRLEVGPEVHGTKMLVVANHPQLAVACYLTEADARRLAACWNACVGVPTEGIEALADWGGVAAADASMKKALAGVEEMTRVIEEEWEASRQLRAQLAAARALLAEVLAESDESRAAIRDVVTERIRAFLEGKS